jgi:hypothetical protein
MLLGAILIPRIGLESALPGIKIAPKSIPAGRGGAKKYKVEVSLKILAENRFHALYIKHNKRNVYVFAI